MKNVCKNCYLKSIEKGYALDKKRALRRLLKVEGEMFEFRWENGLRSCIEHDQEFKSILRLEEKVPVTCPFILEHTVNVEQKNLL